MNNSRLILLALLTLTSATALPATETLIENTKAYTFKTQRGVLGTQDGYLTCTVNSSFKNQGQFALIRYEGQTYLYSVGDKKFTCRETEAYDSRNGGWFNVLLTRKPIEHVTGTAGRNIPDNPYPSTSEERT